MKKEHILVIRFTTLGDVARVVPVVYSLARQYPDIRITMLSRRSSRPLFENLAPNVGFMEADMKHEYHGIRGLNALYRRLAAKQFTAVADLHNVLRSNFLRLRFNLGSQRVAHIVRPKRRRWHLPRRHDRHVPAAPSSLQSYVDVFEQLGFEVNIQFRSIFPTTGGDLAELNGDIGTKAPGTRWIGIAPFSAGRGKDCDSGQVEQLIRHLSSEPSTAAIYLFEHGNQHAVSRMAEWCRKYPLCRPASLVAGGLRQELILLSHMDVLYSGDDSTYQELAFITGTQRASVGDSL